MDGDIIYGDSTFEIGFIGNSIFNSLVKQELRSNNNMILWQVFINNSSISIL